MNSIKEKFISVVIPNFNKAETVGKCIEAALASDYGNFEVIVVDDNSDDGSVDVIKKYPCRLIKLGSRSGSSKARNTGGLNSKGEIIFFIDSDCLLQKDTLSIVNRTFSRTGPGTVAGGTYTCIPYDEDFFSTFQSVFVNYSETKHIEDPDYIAAHAMIVDSGVFRRSGGFPEDFLPIIEDVEYSHRLKRSGYTLVMDPAIQVRHIFDFSFSRSIRNAFRKSCYWNIYSLANRDVLVDSGSASYELKTDVLSFFFIVILSVLWAVSGEHVFLYLMPAILLLNTFVNRKFLRHLYQAKGGLFAGRAFLYYITLYALPVGLGTITAAVKYSAGKRKFDAKWGAEARKAGSAEDRKIRSEEAGR